MNLKRLLNHEEDDPEKDSFPRCHELARRRLHDSRLKDDHSVSYFSQDIPWNVALPDSFFNIPSLIYDVSDLGSSSVETPNDRSFLESLNGQDLEFFSEALAGPSLEDVESTPEGQTFLPPDHLEHRVGQYFSAHNDTSQQDDTCYGMVYQTRIQIVGDPKALKRALNPDVASTIGRYFIFEVSVRIPRLMLLTQDGEDVATLNENITLAMKTFLSDSKVRVQALVHFDNFNRIRSMSGPSKNEQGMANLNIYGPATLAVSVGDTLSARKVYLQKPDWNPLPGYENPHELKLPIRDIGPANFCQIPSAGAIEDSVDSAIADVYSSLTRGNALRCMEGDSRWCTELLPHQQQALDFMAQREDGPVPEPYSLWQRIGSEDQITYQHIVTGTKSSDYPTETGGGVLADEMGMGKTYSTLARIVGTLEAAKEWCQNAEEVYMSTDIPSHKPLCKSTLVIVPTSLLLNSWKTEIEKRLKVKLAVHTHHGPSRTGRLEKILDADIVLTTYHTLVSDYIKHKAPLNQFAWFRIVLDEAHVIRRPSTLLHKRVAELDAKHRWCLTGTPIQNHLDDFGALLVFVKAEPFSRMGLFRRHVSSPFYDNTDRATSYRHLSKLIDSLCIRRTKEILHLNDHHETVQIVKLSLAEEQQYNRTRNDMDNAMRNLEANPENEHQFGIFQADLQLRLLCNHGTYQQREHWANTGLWRARRDTRQVLPYAPIPPPSGPVGRCDHCQRVIHSVRSIKPLADYIDNCEHTVCENCLGTMDDPCPVCEADNANKPKFIGILSPEDMVEEGYFCAQGISSKMNALMKDVCQDIAENKSIIFSCWTTTLDLVVKHLRSRSVHFARIDGRTSSVNRQQILDRFDDDASLPVLIMTTGVGAQGLNLAIANRIFLVEPQWNPSVENQAIGRALRIGQTREVTVFRYIMDQTIEQDVQNRQRRKLQVAKMASREAL